MPRGVGPRRGSLKPETEQADHERCCLPPFPPRSSNRGAIHRSGPVVERIRSQSHLPSGVAGARGAGGLPIGKTLPVVSVETDAGIASKRRPDRLAWAATRFSPPHLPQVASRERVAKGPRDRCLFRLFAAVSPRGPCLTGWAGPQILRRSSQWRFRNELNAFRRLVAGLRLTSLGRAAARDECFEGSLPNGVLRAPGSGVAAAFRSAVVVTASFSRVFPVGLRKRTVAG
jgi:hypothetical protein